MANPNQILDALALATLPEPALVQRIAAMWLRAHQNRAPYNRSEIDKWVKQEFGPVLDQSKRQRLSKELLDETKHQLRLRRRRARGELDRDPLTVPMNDPIRIGQLLKSRLGPARRWVSTGRIPHQSSDCYYIDGAFFSGLVAGLIPVKMRLRRISDPNLLVYRRGRCDAQTRFVPSYITTVADAFIWLIPDDAREFLRMPGIRVEHDGEDQSVRLITPWGVKALPWRELAPVTTG